MMARTEIRSGRRTGRIVVTGLLAWLTACGGGGDIGAVLGAPGDTTPPATSGNPPPAALVGTWGFAVASGNYCDPLGQCAPGSGGSESIAIDPQGRTEYAIFESTLLPGCGEVRTLTRKSGTLAVNGATMVFTPQSGTYTARNACRSDLSGDWTLGAADLAPVTYSWQFVPDPLSPQQNALRIVDPSGQASGVYSRR